MTEQTRKTRAKIILRDNMTKLYDALLHYSYELYKARWCEERGFDPDAVAKAEKDGREFDGQMYVCLSEFEECEWQDESYISDLLPFEIFPLYSSLMQAMAAQT